MKRKMQKAVTWLMIVCMMMGFMSVFGFAASAKAVPVQAAVSVAPQDVEETDETRPDGLFGLLMLLFEAIGVNLKSISVEELLRLPANAMDDVVTYIIAILRAIGVNIDALYEKLGYIISLF